MLSLQRSCEQVNAAPLTFAGLVSELIEHAFEKAWLQGEQHILPQVCALLGISRWTNGVCDQPVPVSANC